jgi:DNA primase
VDQVDEIKQKLDIVSVIGEYTPLKKVGRNYKARCPFHNEKTPSFYVSPDRQGWHCFGCNAGGDMFTFVQKIEGLEFPEALKILAQKAGVELRHFDPRLASQKNRLLDVCATAANFWQSRLNASQSDEVKAYIEKRKIKPSTLIDFKIGWAPDSWDETMKFLLSKGFSETEIFQAGLTVRKEKGTGYYDRFRGRLIFPIQDIHGNVIGFSGRILKSDETAKYINTPETPIYRKGRVLFALDKARQAIREQGYAVVVEGNMDAITCHEACFNNVVACSGTALTPDQISLLKRYTENVALCFDQDSAGQLAAERSIDLLFEAEMNTKIVQLVSGKDPDECIKKNVQDWVDSLKSSKPVMQFYFDQYFTTQNLGDIAKKKKAAKFVLERIAKIKDKIEQDYWLKKMAEIVRVKEDILREAIITQPIKPQSVQGRKTESAGQPKIDFEKNCWERILTILLNYPKLISFAQEYLSPNLVSDEKYQSFYSQLIMFYNSNQAISPEQINQWLAENNFTFEKGYLDSLFLAIEKFYESFSIEQINKELVELINIVKVRYFENKIQELSARLSRAESQGQKELVKQCIDEIQNYSEQLVKLK